MITPSTDIKLTQEKANEIRAKHAAGATRPQLAKEFGVSNTQIRRIIRNQNWTGNGELSNGGGAE